MKFKTGLLFALAIVILFSACKKKRTIVEFDTTYSADFVVDTLKANKQKVVMVNINPNMESNLSGRGTSGEYIGEATCTRVSLSVKAPPSQDLHFIANAMVKMDATSQLQAMLGNRWNAKSDTILPGVKTIDLKPNKPNLKNHVMQSTMKASLLLIPMNNSNTTMTLTTTFTVHVKGVTN